MTKKYSRRDFLKGTILTTAGGLGLSSISLSKAQEEVDGPLYLVDPADCIGCDICYEGCEDYHLLYHREWEGDKPGTFYIDVLGINEDEAIRRREVKTGDRTEQGREWFPDGDRPHLGSQFYLPIQCMHCEDAPCEDACLGNAISTTEDGKVTIDQDSCIGCLSCVSACPFSRGEYHPITYSQEEKKVFKCDMCHERIEDGEDEPACVEVCPTEARLYGNGDEMLERAQNLAEERNGVVVYPEETKAIFVLGQQQLELLEKFDLLWEDYPAASRTTSSILKYSNYGFIPLLLGFLGFTFKYTSQKGDIVKPKEGGEEK